MENMKYGVDYIYEKHGKAVIEKEILADQAAHWKRCYDELKKETDEKIAKLEKDLAETKATEDLWYNEYNKKKTEVEQLKLQIENLEEQLAEKDQMIAGFNHEHGRELAETAREEAQQEGDEWQWLTCV